MKIFIAVCVIVFVGDFGICLIHYNNPLLSCAISPDVWIEAGITELLLGIWGIILLIKK
jgi:hypothetical protein